MALIIVGMLASAALLVVFLAAVLMLILAHEENSSPEVAIRITMVPVGDVTEETMDKSEQIIGQRIKALGIEHYNIYSDSGRVVVEVPAVEDIDRVKRIIGSTAQLQFRQVLEILGAGDPDYESTEVTQVDFYDQEAYRALKDREVVLEKEVEGKVYRLRLGPTRLTGDIIDSAAADISYDSNDWQIDFTLIDDAVSEFADLTGELSEEREPGNQLAIVLDYNIESYPTVFEEITGGEGQITGSFTREEAEDLALVLRLGALPVDFTTPVVEEMP